MAWWFQKSIFDSHQTCILTRRRQQTYKGMAHNMNGDASFTNGLDKENIMHFDKKVMDAENDNDSCKLRFKCA